MIKVKDINVLQRYGFKLDIDTNLERNWEYDCLDNRTYVFVYEKDLIVRLGTPFGDMPALQLTYQLDVLFRLISDGHCELSMEEEEKK